MQKSLAREVYWLLRSTTSTLKGEFRKKIEEFGITWPQYHALYHIGQEGITANELARELQCNASNMTGIIDRMTDNGWVYREQSQEDRRVWVVKMTPQGAQLKDEIFPRHKRYVDQRVGVLNAEELALLQELLIKLKDGVTEEENT